MTRPMIDALRAEHYYTIQLEPGNFRKSYKITEEELEDRQYDCILIMGDRIEMFAATVAAFHDNIPIIHYGSGITNTIATFDDIARHQIALMADVCLCEDIMSKIRVFNLHKIIGRIPYNTPSSRVYYEEYNIYNVGNLYLESLDTIDESLVPSEPYDLVLINPETLRNSYMNEYLSNEYTPKNKKTIWIGSNPDQKECEYWKIIKTDVQFYKNLPRPQYLGLLKNCQRFISNSSSIYYECFPLGLKPEQIIQVGERNKNRSTPREWNQDYKTSEKIVQIIKEWWLEKND